MKCPKCKKSSSGIPWTRKNNAKATSHTEVIESREKEDGNIRRRRQCPFCFERYTTYEVTKEYLVTMEAFVLKKTKTKDRLVKLEHFLDEILDLSHDLGLVDLKEN
jgi:transcriptional regulator NrdR family protein